MAATATIRVRPETRERLKRLSQDRGLSTPDLLDSLVRRAEDDQLLAEHEAAMTRIMADPAQAASYRSELSDWDATLQDGLTDLQ
jgi:predicted DNA-binding protein